MAALDPDMAGEMAEELAAGRLLADYAACIDADELERLPDFFRDSAEYRIVTRFNQVNQFPIAIIDARNRNMLVDRITALRQANIYEAQHYRHILSLPRIVGREDGLVQAETSFMVTRTMEDGSQDLFVSGMYQDWIDFAGERALFARKIVLLDSDKIDTLLAIPL